MLKLVQKIADVLSGCGDSVECYFTRVTKRDGSGPTFDQAREDLTTALNAQQWIHAGYEQRKPGVSPYKRR